MPANTRDKFWVKAHTVEGHYRKYPPGHAERVAKENAAKLRARHKRAARLKQGRKRKNET
jgi:hypothetical protein